MNLRKKEDEQSENSCYINYWVATSVGGEGWKRGVSPTLF